MNNVPSTYKEIHHLVHSLWTKAVGTDDYNKPQWKRLELIVQELWRAATGKDASIF